MTPPLEATLTVNDLHVSLGRKEILKGVSFELPVGMHGLLGPNGAGKSTLFATLVGMVSPTTGTITLGEVPLGAKANREQRALIGYLPQRFDTVGSMRVRDTVQFAAWASGVERDDQDGYSQTALELLELEAFSKQRVRTLSGGQRQRLGIASAIVHRPRLLLLDEPTVGLDPEQRVRVRAYLSKISRPTVVLASTHLVEDLSQIAEHVMIMAEGRLAYRGTTAELAGLSHPGDDFVSPLEAGYRSVIRS